MSAGRADDGDRQAVANYLTKLDSDQRKAFLDKLADSIPDMGAFVLSLYATGGIGTATKEGVEEWAARRLGKYAEGRIAEAAIGTLGVAAKTAAMTTLTPNLIAKEAANRINQHISLSEGDQGRLNAVLGPDAPGIGQALAEGYVSHLLTMGAFEGTGEIAQGLKAAKATQLAPAMKGAIAKTWLQNGGTMASLRTALASGGWDNMRRSWLPTGFPIWPTTRFSAIPCRWPSRVSANNWRSRPWGFWGLRRPPAARRRSSPGSPMPGRRGGGRTAAAGLRAVQSDVPAVECRGTSRAADPRGRGEVPGRP